jgi:ferredoxin
VLNAKFAAVWPSISAKKAPPVDAEEFQGAEGKFDKVFGEFPGPGN